MRPSKSKIRSRPWGVGRAHPMTASRNRSTPHSARTAAKGTIVQRDALTNLPPTRLPAGITPRDFGYRRCTVSLNTEKLGKHQRVNAPPVNDTGSPTASTNVGT